MSSTIAGAIVGTLKLLIKPKDTVPARRSGKQFLQSLRYCFFLRTRDVALAVRIFYRK